jgi:AcrR family transcriptional regulator
VARNPEATREAILGAAEVAFADHGYDGASMQQIATSAGVSRGMPGYAFGSKAALYEAVLERAFAQPRAIAADLASAGGGGDLLTTGIAAYIEFLAGHPTYVRLLQRATLDSSGRLGRGTHRAALADSLPLVGDVTGRESDHDQRQLLISILALCFFPFAHRETLLGPLGFDVDDPDFVADRVTHVVQLLRHGLRRP